MTPDQAEAGRGSGVMRWVGWLGGAATTVVAVAGIVAYLFPSVRPCIGASRASFANAPVFPGVPLRAYLIRNGTSPADAEKEPNFTGAEVRFTFETEGYRGKDLPITYSLFSVADDGSLGPVVGADRAEAYTYRPGDCSDQGSYDLFVQLPPQKGKRYRILLELYRDKELRNRIDLIETEIFHS